MGSQITPKPKLLVIDDEPDNLDLLFRTFYREYQVLRANSGLEALELLDREGEVAVIISDQRMPIMSGTEFLSQMAVKYPDTMRIILTGYTDVEDLVEAINTCKVFKYVTKPWDELELRNVVSQAIDTHNVLRNRTAELRRTLRQQSLLNAIASSADSDAPYREIIATIAESIAGNFEVSASILRLCENGELAEDYFAYSTEPMVGVEQLANSLILRSQIIAISNIDGDSRITQEEYLVYAQAHIKSVLFVPLEVKKECLGMLALYHCESSHEWTSDELDLIELASDQAAIVSSRARAYDQIQELAKRESLLNTITSTIRSSLDPQKIFASITQQLGQALSSESCALSLWTESDQYLRCVGLHLIDPNQAINTSADETILPQSIVNISVNPVFQALIETKQPVAISDLHEDPEWNIIDLPLRSIARSLLMVPLLSDGKIIGSISMRQNQHPRQWKPEEISLVQAVAAQAAIAVQQANLFQKTRQQAQQLLELDRQKTEFFQNLSHEFRTPLTLTIGPLEAAIEQSNPLPYEQSVIALRNCRRLLRLVNQLLDIQRLDAGKMQSCFRPCNLIEFTSQTIDSFRPYCERKNIHLFSEFHNCSKEIYLDLEKFDKVLYNLLSNAMKFTPSNGSITVSIDTDLAQKQCILRVHDTGIGIRQDQIPFLFDRFRQAEGSVNRSYEGSGLGLALVKELVTLHGGDISVDSDYGYGTTFTITIPTGKEHLPAEQITNLPADLQISRASVELADLETDLNFEEDAIASELENEIAVSTPFHKILIVDDNRDLRGYLRRVLNQSGYIVFSAYNGAHGYEQAQKHRPDLIVTDLMMPQVSGLDLISLIRQNEELAGTPIILLTAKANEETRIEGTEMGADGYLAKPFNDRELLAEVRNLLALKTNERRVAQLNLYLTESVLKRFLPPSLVSKAATGKLSLDLRPEPKMITVLFTDIVGFTSLANTLRSRRVAELLNQYLGAMTEAIFANGGTVDKFMGDGIMALFGAPEDCSPNEQVRRAVQTAKHMQRSLAQLNEQWQVQGIPTVRFRCGIHQGTAVVGMFGSAERSDYTAIGPTVNIAARIQAAAEPDCILVSAAVADYLEDEELRKREPLKLKGVDETVLTFFVDS
ncbi:response regulator [Pseudanabaena sp. FACHB-1998]|uniref:response regulator n=1 Tax=Pseudanabaena sp. FACHB-1998 TaxID=2692858 RepID=UPI001680CD5B|nr:response regulator [Pseudanabaena sp. FACHB-1998]MBD2175835.1 response regulator [Pseudanabaena sp. FACHB-1998]